MHFHTWKTLLLVTGAHALRKHHGLGEDIEIYFQIPSVIDKSALFDDSPWRQSFRVYWIRGSKRTPQDDYASELYVIVVQRRQYGSLCQV